MDTVNRLIRSLARVGIAREDVYSRLESSDANGLIRLLARAGLTGEDASKLVASAQGEYTTGSNVPVPVAESKPIASGAVGYSPLGLTTKNFQSPQGSSGGDGDSGDERQPLTTKKEIHGGTVEVMVIDEASTEAVNPLVEADREANEKMRKFLETGGVLPGYEVSENLPLVDKIQEAFKVRIDGNAPEIPVVAPFAPIQPSEAELVQSDLQSELRNTILSLLIEKGGTYNLNSLLLEIGIVPEQFPPDLYETIRYNAVDATVSIIPTEAHIVGDWPDYEKDPSAWVDYAKNAIASGESISAFVKRVGISRPTYYKRVPKE